MSRAVIYVEEKHSKARVEKRIWTSKTFVFSLHNACVTPSDPDGKIAWSQAGREAGTQPDPVPTRRVIDDRD